MSQPFASVMSRVQPGHVLYEDHDRYLRWTCRKCRGAVLVNGPTVWGSVIDEPCPAPAADPKEK